MNGTEIPPVRAESGDAVSTNYPVEARAAVDEKPSSGVADILSELRALVGQDVVLLSIPVGQKGPRFKGWQTTTIERMSDPTYLDNLRKNNIGVLQGAPSNHLCSIDIDDDADVEPFLDLNPRLRETMHTRGSRGMNIWVRIYGPYPPLTKLESCVQFDKEGHAAKWGEWRSTGGQTVIHGKHPKGCNYQIVTRVKPITLRFDEIVWPEDIDPPWEYKLYQELIADEGQPYVPTKNSVKLNHPFFVSKFATEHLILHEPNFNDFFSYDESRGVWVLKTGASVKEEFSGDLKGYADDQHLPTIQLLRTNTLLNGLTDMLRGKVEKSDAFAKTKKVLHLGNGMLHLDVNPPELREFSPHYYSRNQSPYAITGPADCPRFKKELLESALDPDDISLIQRWCGALLLGGNQAQRIVLFIGIGGGGKSTLLEVIENIIGLENVTELRTSNLGGRFEFFRYIGKTFLTGKDVPAEFMMEKGTSMLKKLVGHDLITPEGKNMNEATNLKGDFGVAITSNSQLRVRLEGDAGAWRRRLIIIDYNRPPPEKKISEFSQLLLKEEGPGILIWMIQGAMMHLKELEEHGNFVLTAAQLTRVDALLAESDSIREFVKTRLKREPSATVTVEELTVHYELFCKKMGWHSEGRTHVEREMPELIKEIYGIAKRNDVQTPGYGTEVRGYKGLQICFV
jgi:P4 family phage/plasmid primase-like protien